MTNKVDDIREIIQVGDLFKHTWPSSMEDGTTFDTYYQVFAVTKKSVKVAEVNVPKKYDFTKKKLLNPKTQYAYNPTINAFGEKTYFTKKIRQSKWSGTYIIISTTAYYLAK